jgi:hypothetical protein
MLRPLAEVEPYRRVGSKMTRADARTLSRCGSHLTDRSSSQGFEQGDSSWKKIFTRALLERDVFWTYA